MARMSLDEFKNRNSNEITTNVSDTAVTSTGRMSLSDFKKIKLTERTNSWLKNSVGYFSVGEDEYTPEFFSSRSKTASELSGEADSILESFRSSFGEESEEFKGFKSYYDNFKRGLDDSVSYYNQNPYMVKYKDSDIDTVNSKIAELSGSGSKAFDAEYWRTRNEDNAKELEGLNAMKQYLQATTGHGLTVDDADGDGKVSIKDVTKNQLGNETEEQKFIRENIGTNISDIKDSEEYRIGESYFNAAENSLIRINGFDISALTEDNRDIMKYLTGKKLKEKGYNSFNAGDLESSEYLAQLPESEDWSDVNSYLDSIQDERSRRIAKEQFEKIKDKPVLEVAEMLKQGLISNPVGIYRSLAFGKDNTDYSVGDYLTQMIDEDLADSGAKLPEWLGGRSIGQVFGSLAQSTGQMLPSMALSAIPYVGGALSSVSFGMSSGGNAKVELMREGYDETTATIYGMLVGSAEAGLEKLMGSIPGLSSSAGKGITKGIKNAFLKAAADYGIDVVKEAVEESSQEVLEPIFRRVATWDWENFSLEEFDLSEIAYAGFQGAIMSGGTNAPGTAIGAVKDNKSVVSKNADSFELQSVNAIVNEGLNRGENTKAYKYASELQKRMTNTYDKAISKGKSEAEAEVEATRKLKVGQLKTLVDMNIRNADGKTSEAIKARLTELGAKGDLDSLTKSIYKQLFINTYGAKAAESVGVELSRSQKKALNGSEYAQQVLEELNNSSQEWAVNLKEELSQNRYEAKNHFAYKEGMSATKLKEIDNISSDNAARTSLHKNGIGAQVISTKGSVGVVGVEYSDGKGVDSITYRTSEGEIIKGSDLEFDLDYMGYIIKTAPEHLPKQSANAMIKAAVEHNEYAQSKGAAASSDRLISSFNALRDASMKGITYEQAKEDIHLSGDIANLGEVAARIAINDGFAIYENRTGKAKANAEKKAEYKKATPKKGAVTLAENVKLNGDITILNSIAKNGNVAIVIEKFSGADKYAKGFYAGGVIHLNADRLSEGGFTYTGIHESVHFVRDVNLEGYKAIEKFIKNFYKEKGVDLNTEIKLTQDFYAKKGQKLTPEEAMEEIVCNTLSDIATDEDALTAFLGLNKKTQNNFIEAIKAIARKLKEWANEHLRGTEYHKTVINDADTLLELAKKLKAELQKAGQKNNTAENSGVKYDIAYLENGNTFVRASRNVITATTLDGRRSQITKFFNMLLSQDNSIDIPTVDGDILTITRDATADKARDNYKNINGNRVKLTDEEFLVKLNVEAHIDEIVETSRGNKKTPVPDTKNHDFAKDGFTYRRAYFEDFDDQYYEITLSIGHNGTVATVYNVGKIEKSVLPSAKIIAGAGSRALGKTLSKYSISNDNGNVKQKQLEIIQKTNPAPNEYSTWVRTVEDIKTLAETLEDDDWSDGGDFNPDLSSDDIQEAIERGSITVYSSYPIENGVFVSPSRMEAESYSGTGEVYEKTVDIRDVAWIDPTQGQYAKVEAETDIKVDYSLSPESDAEYLSAVESGDTETAQRLVVEAAESAMRDSKIRDSEGKLVKVYHGSEAEDFSVFDKNRRGQTDGSMYGRGYYFAFDPDYSSDFGENIRTFYLDIKNPYYIDINAPASVIADFLISKGVEVDFDYSNMISHYFAKNFGSQRFTDTLVKLGYDGVVVRTDEGDNFETVAFHRSQMKLADAVTYDDTGNVIPLSERFNMKKKDVRYSFDEDGVTYEDEFVQEDGKTSIKQQVVENQEKLDKMKVVSSINSNIFFKNKRDVIQWALEKFEHIDYKVVRENFGEVVLDKKRISKGARYLKTNEDRLSFALVPDVIRFGIEIGRHTNHKNRNYETITFGAPVEINGVRGDMAVVIRREDNNYYKVHRVVMPNGSEVILKEKRDTAERAGGVNNNSSLSPTDNVSNNIVPKFNGNVNKKSYSFGDEELHYGVHLSDKSERGKYLRNTARAIGTLLKLTRRAKVDVSDVTKSLNKALKIYKVAGESEMVTDRIFEVLSIAEKQQYVDGGAVLGEIALAVKHGFNRSKLGYDFHKTEREDVLKSLKDIGDICLSREQKYTLKEMGLNYEWFKRNMYTLSKVVVTDRPSHVDRDEGKITRNATSLDDVWHVLSKAYPQWFSGATLSEERPFEMIKTLEELKPQLVVDGYYYALGTDELALKVANKVLSDIINTKYKKLKDEKLEAEVKKLKAKQSDNMQKWLSKQESQRGRKGIERIYGELYKKLSKPTKKQSIPEDFIVPTAQLLKSLGLSKGILDNRETKRIKNEKGEWITVPNDRKGQPIIHDVKVLEKGATLGSKIPYGLEAGTINENLLKIVNLLQDKELSRFGEGYDMDIDLNLIEDMKSFAKNVRKQNIYDMTAEETSRLHSILFRYRNTLASANRLNSENITETLGELGWNTINELNAQGESKVLNSKFNNILFFDTADALTVFERFGPSGMKIYRELRDGFDKYTLKLAEVRDFAKKHLNSKNIRKWMKEKHSISLSNGQTVELSITEIMNVYCLNERQKAREHLYENTEDAGKIVVKDKKGKNRTYRVTEGDINTIIAKLNKEQKDCCEQMIRFLSEKVAEWGNEVTMRRYLYRAFTVERYFPIIVDGMSFNINDFNASKTASFWGVANPKASKSTKERARKPLIIQDVFDVFAQHCGDMAMYHGMGEAVMDAMKWYNYSPDGNNGVRKAMSDNLSNEACEWFETFIKDLNGAVKSDDVSLMQGFIRGSKSALIWMNLRVVIQQPTAYIRAANVIDAKYLVNPKNLNIVNRIADKENYEKGSKKALKYCPIVMFKSWGYFSNDIGKSTKDMMLDTENAYEKAKSIGFVLAGKADTMTLGWLWNACEKQVADKNKNLKQGSEEFNKAVAELLTRVIDETQVVDTPFHRSQIRRKKTGTAQVFAAFMDEPIKSYNMIMRAILSGDGKKVARALATHIATVVLGQALVKALYDLIVKWDKDEDEDEKRGWDDFFELYLKNLVDDLNPLSMNPYLSILNDLIMQFASGLLPENEFVSGTYSTSSLENMGTEKAGWLLASLGKLINPDKEVNLTAYGWIYKTAEVVGTFTGIGVHNVMNFATSIWNQRAPANLKVTKTEYSNTYIANEAVEAMLKGKTSDYEFYYKELSERYKGDTSKIQSALGSALSKSDSELVREAYAANESDNKAARDKAYGKLEALGFELAVIKRGIESYESTYNNCVKKVAQAQIDGEKKAEQEALDWIKEQGVFNDKYEDDIVLKKSELEQDALKEADSETAYETQFLINALNNGEMESFEDAFEELLNECETVKDEGKLRTKVKSAVTTNYKYDYWLAYRDGDKAKIKEIESVLEETGLYEGEILDTTKEWIKENIRACYEDAVSTENLEDMNRYKYMLLRSGVYSSEANARKALDSWRKTQQQKK